MVDSESLTPPPAEAAPPPKKYGVTKPLSLAGPTDADLQRNATLEKFLKESELYESEEETARRVQVLHQLDQGFSRNKYQRKCREDNLAEYLEQCSGERDAGKSDKASHHALCDV
ncbi:hypothetical protein CQW23_19342 [Capsicum baccatum]|uniref:Poly(A) polymerase nucleotidyltransferase domain-containing protein n=1 Tax=Capsicum baccatum TaxID=33114 RepID=A0A2G2W5J2_CAPBA|nr:hypothetical protein CQW23_19342 [Capsicum baccatum]